MRDERNTTDGGGYRIKGNHSIAQEDQIGGSEKFKALSWNQDRALCAFEIGCK
jgi:hypothetical protein